MPDIVPAGTPRGPSDVDPRRRTLADQELINSLGWLVRTRWFAGLGVLAAGFVAAHLLALPVPEASLYGVGLFILVYNAALFRWLGQLERSGQDAMDGLRAVCPGANRPRLAGDDGPHGAVRRD